MQITQIIIGAVGAAGILLSVAHAGAAPPKPSALAPTTAVTTASERCWRSHGVRQCRGFNPRYYGYRRKYREYNNPDAYRIGSSHWWQEMDRLDRGGRGRR